MTTPDDELREALQALRATSAEHTELLRTLHEDMRALGGGGAAPPADLWQRLGLGEGERRRVTVMFADVSGFTALAETLDPEECALMMRDTLAALASRIRDFGGHVEKFIGDAICAIFGAPEAHDNEPERAVRAALALHQLMAERAESRPDLPPMTVHTGVNTGVVVAGTIADGTQFGVMGDTINTAARLMDKAGSTETYVSAETARRIRHGFLLEDVGVLEMKGKQNAVQAFNAVREIPHDADAVEHDHHGVLVGRDVELAQLRAAVEQVRVDARRAAVLILGEPGGGKGRLVAEVVPELRKEMRVLRASAHLTHGRPFGVVAEAIRPLIEDLPDDRERQILETLYSEELSPDELETTLAGIILSAASERPVAIVLTDLEAADRGTHELVRFLILATIDGAVMWLLTARAGASGVQSLAADPSVTTIELAPLSTTDISHLLQTMLPGALDDEAALRLADRAAGNPEFAEELALSLIDHGIAMEQPDGTFQLQGNPDDIRVPATVQELIETRFDALPDAARQVAREASVIGERFSRKLLAAVTTLPALLDSALAELVESELVRPPSMVGASGVYEFRGQLVRDTIYGGMLRRQAASKHLRVAEALAREYAGRESDAAEDLADHYEAAGRPREAVHFLRRAVENAVGNHATATVVDLVSRGLALCAAHPSDVEPDAEKWLRTRLDETALSAGTRRTRS